MQGQAVAGGEPDRLGRGEGLRELDHLRAAEKGARLRLPVHEIVLEAFLGEDLDGHEALGIIEAEDVDARRDLAPEGLEIRLQRRVEEVDRLAAGVRHDGEGGVRPRAHDRPLEVEPRILVDERLRPGREIDADEREPVAPTAGQEPEPAVVRRDVEHPEVELLEVQALELDPAALAQDLERARLGADPADPRARAAVRVGEPVEDVAGVLGDQHRLARVEVHPVQVEDRPVPPVPGDDDVGRIPPAHAVNPGPAA
ncbi:MAG: hypothetical protein HYS36_03105, partial [Candidatus Rokubacteria bacterium]|nr:hypothetical protein [Candidatus Rokubacteria bacterium]